MGNSQYNGYPPQSKLWTQKRTLVRFFLRQAAVYYPILPALARKRKQAFASLTSFGNSGERPSFPGPAFSRKSEGVDSRPSFEEQVELVYPRCAPQVYQFIEAVLIDGHLPVLYIRSCLLQSNRFTIK